MVLQWVGSRARCLVDVMAVEMDITKEWVWDMRTVVQTVSHLVGWTAYKMASSLVSEKGKKKADSMGPKKAVQKDTRSAGRRVQRRVDSTAAEMVPMSVATKADSMAFGWVCCSDFGLVA
jgi:hypothetical protein